MAGEAQQDFYLLELSQMRKNQHSDKYYLSIFFLYSLPLLPRGLRATQAVGSHPTTFSDFVAFEEGGVRQKRFLELRQPPASNILICVCSVHSVRTRIFL